MYSFDFGEYSFASETNLKQGYKPTCAQNKCYFSYPCDSQTFCVPIEIKIAKGKYFFEVFGAQGGIYYTTGGMGGYAAATITFLSNMSVFLLIGSMGAYRGPQAFNGGGSASIGSSGGGATDFRMNSGILSSRFLIAGGGGGEYNSGSGGFGGGENGGPKNLGASQTGPGIDGVKGEPGKGVSAGNCGGGGGLYGGNAGNEPCGGGSGFVYSKNRTTKIIDDIDESLMKVENGILHPSANGGDGYASITLISSALSDKYAVINWKVTCPCRITQRMTSYYLLYTLMNTS